MLPIAKVKYRIGRSRLGENEMYLKTTNLNWWLECLTVTYWNITLHKIISKRCITKINKKVTLCVKLPKEFSPSGLQLDVCTVITKSRHNEGHIRKRKMMIMSIIKIKVRGNLSNIKIRLIKLLKLCLTSSQNKQHSWDLR